jgi:hypothetical protein
LLPDIEIQRILMIPRMRIEKKTSRFMLLILIKIN